MDSHLCYVCGRTIDPAMPTCPQCHAPLLLQGKFRVTGVLGHGGFSVVYDAIDVRFGRRCAIKSISITYLFGPHDEREAMRQIDKEAHILAQHASRLSFMPHIYDIVREPGYIYLVMEYIEGSTLDQIVAQRGPWSSGEVEHFLTVLLRNLAQLHAVGIIHRDLKPQNIKATPNGRCAYMVLDFGIAKQGSITLIKAASPDFAPPEQRDGYPTDERADLYSVAATAYYVLTGITPFQAMLRAGGRLPPPRQVVPAVPHYIETTLMQMLQADPNDRPANAAAALALLRQIPPPQSQARHAIAPPAYRGGHHGAAQRTPHQPKMMQQARLAWRRVLSLVMVMVLCIVGYWAWREFVATEAIGSATSTTMATTDRGDAGDPNGQTAVAGMITSTATVPQTSAGNPSSARTGIEMPATATAPATTVPNDAEDQRGADAGAPTATPPATPASTDAGGQRGTASVGASSPSGSGQTPSSEDPVAVLRAFDRAMSTGAAEEALALFTDDAVYARSDGSVARGKDQIRDVIQYNLSLDGYTRTSSDYQAVGNTVTGTFRASWNDGQPRSRSFRVEAVIEGGKIKSLTSTAIN